jgi:hypothetical protein
MFPGAAPNGTQPLAEALIDPSYNEKTIYVEELSDSVVVAGSFLDRSPVSASDYVIATGAHVGLFAAAIVDRLLATDSSPPLLILRALLSDTMRLAEALPMATQALIADGVTLSDESPGSLRQIAELAEILSAADGQYSTLQIATMLMDLLAAREALSYVQVASLEDTLDTADQLSAAIRQITESADFVTMTEALRFRMTALISDQVSADDLIHPQLHVLMGYSDTMVVIDGLVLDDGEPYTAWVMNAESTGMSRWTLPQLNSLFDHGGEVFGVSKTGLWKLGGDTDDGAEIDAWVKTGHLDFGTSRLKNISRGYLRVQSDGAMQLVTISSDRGVRTERPYELSATFSGDDAALRTEPLARGLYGVHWQFQIGNVDGVDFNLDEAEIRPVILSRRGR